MGSRISTSSKGAQLRVFYITKKIRSVNPVHMSFWLNGVFAVSGAETSGSRGVKGFMRSRNRRPLILAVVPLRGLQLLRRTEEREYNGTPSKY